MSKRESSGRMGLNCGIIVTGEGERSVVTFVDHGRRYGKKMPLRRGMRGDLEIMVKGGRATLEFSGRYEY